MDVACDAHHRGTARFAALIVLQGSLARNLPMSRLVPDAIARRWVHDKSWRINMRRSALWLLTSLSIATTACIRTHTNEATGAVDVDIESPTKKGEDWKGELRGEGMYASVRGKTGARYAEGKTSVTV